MRFLRFILLIMFFLPLLIKNSFSAEETIIYKSDSLKYFIKLDKLVLFKNAEIKYGNYTLISDSLEYFQKEKRAFSFSNSKLLYSNQYITGDSMKIDIENQNGLIYYAYGVSEDGYFWGDKIKANKNKVFYIENAIYTTCDEKVPHYYFFSKKMKIVSNDMVYAKPIILYIDDVPLFYLPFGFFSINKEPHSGFILPVIGIDNSSSTGRFIRDFGYFWLINKKMNNTLYFSYWEKTGWQFNNSFVYTDNKAINGNMNLLYARRDFGTGSFQKYWEINGNHSQKFSNRNNLFINYNYVNSKDILINSDNIQQRLTSTITSNLLWNYTFLNNDRLSVQINHNKDLVNNTETLILPNVSFSMPVKTVFNSSYFLEKINLSYNSSAINKFYYSHENINNIGIKHNILFTFNFSNIGFIKLQGNSNYTEQWFKKHKGNKDWVRRAFLHNNSFSMSTNIYGYFDPFGNLSLRHVITPQISLVYTPDIYWHGLDKFDKLSVSKYDSSFYETYSKQKRIAFNLSNILQTKYKIGETVIKNSNLMNFNISTSYNPEYSKRKWSDISGSFGINPNNIKLGKQAIDYNLTGNTNYDPYDGKFTYIQISNGFRFNLFFSENKSIEDSLSNFSKKNTPVYFSTTHYYFKDLIYNYVSQKLSSSINFYLTTHWKINYTHYYDLDKWKIISQGLDIYRDLHCWELKISWQKSGSRWSYTFLVNVKEIPDIKWKSYKSSSQ